MTWRHASGLSLDWAIEKLAGRPLSRVRRDRRSISSSKLRPVSPNTACSTPRPPSPNAIAIASSSVSAAWKVGIASPCPVLWMTSREVAKPSAPASIASRTTPCILARSSAVAGSRSAPRWPMT